MVVGMGTPSLGLVDDLVVHAQNRCALLGDMHHSGRRPFQRLEEMLPGKCGRRLAGKVAELAHQMRLVGIAAIGGDIGPIGGLLP